MLDNKELREVYCDSLLKLTEEGRDIVVIEADLMKATGTGRYFKAYPERSFDVGIAEANMIGVAAGMSTYGKIPFCASFGAFSARRCYDQIFVSGAYSKQNIKVIGTDPGISAEINGGTHMPFEDMGNMRVIPNMVCVEPTDAAMLEAIMPKIADYKGMVYMRLFRKKAEKIYEDGSDFDLFKAKWLKTGNDATIICSGIMVEKSIRAAKILEEKGYDVGILNCFTWKPIDKEAVLKAAKESGAIVTAENHNIINGLGSAVAEILVENCLIPMERVGINDEFGEVGKMDYLEKRFRISAEDIAEKTEKVIKRKTK